MLSLKIDSKKIFILMTTGLFGTSCSLFGVHSEEQPTYEVLVKKEDKEIRKYQSHIVAKTTIQGTFEEAQSKGFKILAGYIFGKNKSQKKIEMTAPVVQAPEPSSEKISMTAPVVIAPDEQLQDGKTGNSWTMTFSMPSEFTVETLPTPDDDRIKIEKVAPRIVAASTFTGFWSESKNQKKGNELLEWLNQYPQYKAISPPMFAGYNPPWTLPFFRRNEMLVELEVSK
jgi:hypothetical protein